MPLFGLPSSAACCCSVAGGRNEEHLKSIDSACYKVEQAEGSGGA
jgi:hypothetical protein